MLTLTAATSLIAWYWPSPTTYMQSEPNRLLVVQASAPSLSVSPVPALDSAGLQQTEVAHPRAISPPGSARFDPFVGLPLVVPVPVATAVTIAPQVLAAPQPPPVGYRYYGALASPDGTPIMLLARDENVVQAEVGRALDDGYVVERIGVEGIHLLFPALEARALIPIPPALHEPLTPSVDSR